MQVGDFILHNFQENAVNSVRGKLAKLIHAGKNPRVVLASPTGSGKTVVASMLISLAVDKGKRVGFITTGRILIHQMSQTLEKCGIEHSVMMSGHKYEPAQVSIVSKDTYESRVTKKKKIFPVHPDMWIVDECDVCTSAQWQDILTDNDPVVVGLTATPITGDGKSLKPFYSGIVNAASNKDLIESGVLVDIPEGNIYSPYRPDLSGINVSAGEYNAGQLEKRMNRDALVGDIFEWWDKITKGERPTVVFCAGVQHSIHVAEAFCGKGVIAEHIDAKTPQDERDDIFRRLRNGSVKVVTNCAVLDRGWNEPCISCCVMAKPTNRLRTYLQQIGRIRRSFEGKKDAVVIDHAGAFWKHGWPTRDYDWNTAADDNRLDSGRLDGGTTTNSDSPEPWWCPVCATIMKIGDKSCPNCGHRARRRGQPQTNIHGKLVPVKRKDHKPAVVDSQKVWMSCLGIAANTNRSFYGALKIFENKVGPKSIADLFPMPKESLMGQKVSHVYPGFVRKRKKLKR